MGEIKVVTEQLDAAYKLFDKESGRLYYIKKQIDGCKNRLRDGLLGLVLDPMYSKMDSASMSADFLGSKLKEISNVLLMAKKEYEDADNELEAHENEVLDNLRLEILTDTNPTELSGDFLLFMGLDWKRKLDNFGGLEKIIMMSMGIDPDLAGAGSDMLEGEAAGGIIGSGISAFRCFKTGDSFIAASGFGGASKGASESKIIPEISEVGANKVKHILQDKHLWGNVVDDPNDWNQVSKVMSKVMDDGVEEPYKNVFSKTLNINGYTVEVTYTKLSDGTIKVSDGWVRP